MKIKNSYFKYILHVLVLAGLIVAAVKYLNGPEIYQALREFDYRYMPFILALSAGYFVLKAWRFVLLMRPLDGDLPAGVIFKVYIAGQTASLLPGGVAARAGMLKQVDVPVGQGSIPVLFNSGLDHLVLIAVALIAALWFEPGRMPVLILLGVIAAGALALLIPATRRWVLAGAGSLAEKFEVEKQWQGFLEALPVVVNWRTMLYSVGLTIVAFGLHIVAFDLSLRGLGSSLSYTTLILAYSLPTVLGRLSGLPGGVGVTGAGMVGFLTSVSDLSSSASFAAVAIFRIAVIVFPALLGAIVYFAGWRGEKETAASTSSSSSAS